MSKKEFELDSLLTDINCSVQKIKVILEDMDDYFSLSLKTNIKSTLLYNYEQTGIKLAITLDILCDIDKQLKALNQAMVII